MVAPSLLKSAEAEDVLPWDHCLTELHCAFTFLHRLRTGCSSPCKVALYLATLKEVI